jgi:uncharacterized membrane protein YphA (DoxX/SURF4 family)
MTRHLPTAARITLGSLFLVFGLNGFFGFLPAPPVNPEAGAFLGALAATGYFFPLLKGTEVIAGALLLSGYFVPLALVVLAPIVVQILAYHSVLAPALGLPLVLLTLGIYLAYAYRDSFRGVLAPRAQPVVATTKRTGRYAHAAHA